MARQSVLFIIKSEIRVIFKQFRTLGLLSQQVWHDKGQRLKVPSIGPFFDWLYMYCVLRQIGKIPAMYRRQHRSKLYKYYINKYTKYTLNVISFHVLILIWRWTMLKQKKDELFYISNIFEYQWILSFFWAGSVRFLLGL